MILHDFLQHRDIERDIERTSAHRSELPEKHILGHACAVITLADRGGFHEYLDRLLERASHQSTCVCAINAVTRDGHERSAVRHDIDKQA